MSENNIIAIIESNEIQNFIGYNENQQFDLNNIFASGNTLLSWAVRKSNLENVTSLVQRGANVNQPEKGGATPLLLAVHLNRLSIVKYLVNEKASVNLGDSYDTPLTVAVRKQNLEVIKFLVDSGAKIDVINIEGLSPLFWAIEKDKVNILELLVRKGIPTDAKNACGDSPLIAAVKNDCSKETIQCILRKDVEVNEAAFVWAVKKGLSGVIKVLIDNGADGNMVCSDGNTLLATAVRYKQMEVVKCLTCLGVNVCKVDAKGKTPLLWAIQNEDLHMIKWLVDCGATYIIDSVFLDAIATKNLAVVQMLYEQGTDKNHIVHINKGTTPLAKALDVESVEIVKYLLSKGATFLDDLNGGEISYLLVFLENKNYEMVKLLTDNGARLDKFGNCGGTALTKAVQLEDFEMISYFVRCGANVNQPNKHMLTPLALAARVNDFRTFQYLVDSGANIDNDRLRLDENLIRFYQIAQENVLKRQAVLEAELASNQEQADSENEEVEEVLNDVVDDDCVKEKTLAERNYYVIEFD